MPMSTRRSRSSPGSPGPVISGEPPSDKVLDVLTPVHARATSLSVRSVQLLQALAGNQAVTRLIAQRTPPDPTHTPASVMRRHSGTVSSGAVLRCPLSSKDHPSLIAAAFIKGSTEFRALHARANLAVREAHGTDIQYTATPTGSARPAAEYLDDTVYIKGDDHPQMRALNLVYETAHAVRAGDYKKLQADYRHGLLQTANVFAAHVGSADLGEWQAWANTPEHRYALIAEYFEWGDLQYAKPSFEQIWSPTRMSEDEKLIFDGTFGHLLSMSFVDYMKEPQAKIHLKATLDRLTAPKGGEKTPAPTVTEATEKPFIEEVKDQLKEAGVPEASLDSTAERVAAKAGEGNFSGVFAQMKLFCEGNPASGFKFEPERWASWTQAKD